MAQMINDTLQNVYNRIAQIGKSLSELQNKLTELNNNLNTKVQKLTESIVSMTETSKKEGESYKLILEQISKRFLEQIKILQSDIGLQDLLELKDRLKKINEESEIILKPETVNVLLDEVLKGIKQLTGAEQQSKEELKKSQE